MAGDELGEHVDLVHDAISQIQTLGALLVSYYLSCAYVLDWSQLLDR